MAQEGRRSIPAWLRHVYLYTSKIQYPRRKEGGRMGLRLNTLLRVIKATKYGWRDVDVCDVTCDSRRVRVGSLFVAIAGTELDGAEFVEDALGRGASAIVTEHPVPGCHVPVLVVADARVALGALSARMHGDPTAKMNVVGVTGTNGKTTVTYLIKSRSVLTESSNS